MTNEAETQQLPSADATLTLSTANTKPKPGTTSSSAGSSGSGGLYSGDKKVSATKVLGTVK